MANYNKKYSFKDFTHQKFTDIDPSEFNNSEIKGSCFYQENEPNSIIFPENMTGVTFKNCNLDNVLIPSGNTLVNCTNNNMLIQNDGEDWIINEQMEPIRPKSMKSFIRLGLSVDPKDIPIIKESKSIIFREKARLANIQKELDDKEDKLRLEEKQRLRII